MCRTMLSIRNFIFSLLLFGLSYPLFAIEDIAVLSLIGDKAILRIDGVHRVIHEGEETPEGLKLIAIEDDRRSIRIWIDSGVQTYQLGFGTDTTDGTLEVVPDDNGMYLTSGKINDIPVSFIVDTGATFVTLNKNIADQLGIDYRQASRQEKAETANGPTHVYIVMLDEIQVGEIILRKVEAAVHGSDYPSVSLLGMSFLKQMDILRDGSILRLYQK